MAEATALLVDQVLAGGDRKLRVLAARGMLPLSPEELIPLQVRLTSDPDPEIAGRASAALKLVEPRLLADYLGSEAGEAELAWFCGESDHPMIVEAILRRRDVPRHLLCKLAPGLDAALQEILILRQDAIIEEPAILEALEENPRLDSNVRRRIHEYRQHLIPRQAEPEELPEAEPLDLEDDGPDEETVRAAIIEVSREPPSGEQDEVTGLTEGQIRMLPAPVRLKLARGAPRTLRSILLRDSNPLVACEVLTHNALSDDEVEQTARSRSVAEEVLQLIGRRREWMRKYGIVYALATNPRTPVGVARGLLPRLSIRDLRNLSFNRNLPDAVRSMARRIHQAKTR